MKPEPLCFRCGRINTVVSHMTDDDVEFARCVYCGSEYDWEWWQLWRAVFHIRLEKKHDKPLDFHTT